MYIDCHSCMSRFMQDYKFLPYTIVANYHNSAYTMNFDTCPPSSCNADFLPIEDDPVNDD